MRFETYDYLDIEYNSNGAYVSDDKTYMIFVAQKSDAEPGDGVMIKGHTDTADYEIYGFITDVHDFSDGTSEYVMTVEVMYEVIGD